MSILNVAHMGHPILRKSARAIDPDDIESSAIQRLIDDMIETMAEYHGAGLAAPQVHVDLRLFVAITDADDEPDGKPIVLVNPGIALVGTDIVEDWESCLSIPDVRGRVPRAREIAVRALDRHGARLEITGLIGDIAHPTELLVEFPGFHRRVLFAFVVGEEIGDQVGCE